MELSFFSARDMFLKNPGFVLRPLSPYAIASLGHTIIISITNNYSYYTYTIIIHIVINGRCLRTKAIARWRTSSTRPRASIMSNTNNHEHNLSLSLSMYIYIYIICTYIYIYMYTVYRYIGICNQQCDIT